MITLGLTLARPSLAPASPPTRPSLALEKVFYWMLIIGFFIGNFYWVFYDWMFFWMLIFG